MKKKEYNIIFLGKKNDEYSEKIITILKKKKLHLKLGNFFVKIVSMNIKKIIRSNIKNYKLLDNKFNIKNSI